MIARAQFPSGIFLANRECEARKLLTTTYSCSWCSDTEVYGLVTYNNNINIIIVFVASTHQCTRNSKFNSKISLHSLIKYPCSCSCSYSQEHILLRSDYVIFVLSLTLFSSFSCEIAIASADALPLISNESIDTNEIRNSSDINWNSLQSVWIYLESTTYAPRKMLLMKRLFKAYVYRTHNPSQINQI